MGVLAGAMREGRRRQDAHPVNMALRAILVCIVAFVGLLGSILGGTVFGTSIPFLAPQTGLAQAGPASCPTPLALVNGSFESPGLVVVPTTRGYTGPGSSWFSFGSGQYDIPAAQVPGWTTTGQGVSLSQGIPDVTGNMGPAFEYWRNGALDAGSPVSAFAGNNFTELNAETAGTVSQTLDTTNLQGFTLDFSLAHRGRKGVDTMQIAIGPAGGSANFTQQFSDGQAWGVHTGTYTVPMGQTSTTFSYSAVSAVGGVTQGNFLDDIKFGTPDECNPALSIVKTTTATKAVLGQAIPYTFTVTNTGNVPLNGVTVTDPMLESGSLSPASVDGVIAGQSVSFTGTHIVTQADLDAANGPTGTHLISNTAIAEATNPTGAPNPGTPNGKVQSAPDTADVPAAQPPVATDDHYSTSLNTTLTVPAGTGLLANDTDPDDPNFPTVKTGYVVAVVTQPNPADGTLTQNPDGSFTFEPTTGFTGEVTYTYTVTDPNTNISNIATVTITVTELPIAVDDTYVGNYNAPLIVPVGTGILVNDSDANNPNFPDDETITVTTQPAHGLLVQNPDGSFTYTPEDGFSGTDTYTYTLTDADGNVSEPATVTIIVPAPPVAQDDTKSTGMNIPVDGQVTATDPDTAPEDLTYTKATDPTNGTVTVNPDGTYTYTPNDGFTGTDTFTYTVTDPEGNTDTATVTITVTAPPVATPDEQTTPLNTPVDGTVTATDPDTAPEDLTYTVEPGDTPANGTVTMNPDGTYTYTPNDGFTGVDTFTYTVTDPEGNTDTALVTITVTAPPVANPDDKTTPLNTPVNGQVTATDPDTAPEDLTYTKATDPTNGTVIFNPDGTYTYTPNDGFTGQDTFTYTVTDPEGNTDTETVTIHVNSEPPVAQDDTKTTPLNTVVGGQLVATDPDTAPEDLTYTKATDPTNGTVIVNEDGTYTYVPNPGYTGTDTFTYTVTDPEGNTDTATVTITVTAPPVANPDEQTTPLNTPIDGTVTATDPDTAPEDLTYTKATDPSNGTVIVNPDGTYTYTPNAGFVGDDTFTYTVTDPEGNSDTATVTIHVTSQPPVAQDDTKITPFNTSVDGQVTATDPDTAPEDLTYTKATDPTNGTVTMNPDGTYTYTPNDGFVGEDTFTYTVTDPEGNTDTATVTITVVSQPPVANPDEQTTPLNTPVDGQVTATDPDTAPEDLTYTVEPGDTPANGTVTMNPDGTYTYTPNNGFAGDDTFTYTVTDPEGNTSTSTVTIHVLTAPPVAEPDAKVTTPNTPVNGQLTATDPDTAPEDLTYTKATDPSNGTVIVNPDGTYTYTPNDGFTGTDSFTYTVTDPEGNTSTNTVTIEITAPETAGLLLEKTADPNTIVYAGDTITYTYVVTNIGTVAIDNVVVIDPMPNLSPLTGPTGTTLQPNETATFVATYLVTQDDVANGFVQNTAVVRGTDPNGSEVTSQDTVDVRACPTDATTAESAQSAAPTEIADVSGEAATPIVETPETGSAAVDCAPIPTPTPAPTQTPIPSNPGGGTNNPPSNPPSDGGSTDGGDNAGGGAPAAPPVKALPNTGQVSASGTTSTEIGLLLLAMVASVAGILLHRRGMPHRRD